MRKPSLPLLMLTCLLLSLPPALRAQESVDVPQILQKDVHSFYLTIDSLQTLTENIEARTRTMTQELQMIEQKMALTPVNTRAYLLERRRYEEKLSQHLAERYETLEEIQALRLKTIAHLEEILSRLQATDGTANNALLDKIRDQIRQNNQRVTQTRGELLQVLADLKKPELSPDAALHLNRKFQRLQNERLALYLQNQKRLANLHARASQNDGEMPGVQQSLRTMWENLHNGFAWIESEMDYISVYADWRKNWLTLDARLLEVSGLVDRFRDVVKKINNSNKLLKDIEQYELPISADSNGNSLLPEMPTLHWPGQPPLPDRNHVMTPAEIDSIQRVLQQEIKKANEKGAPHQ